MNIKDITKMKIYAMIIDSFTNNIFAASFEAIKIKSYNENATFKIIAIKAKYP